MANDIGNYAKHAQFWDWSKLDHDRTPDNEYWYKYAKRYGNNILIPMCALGETGVYMAEYGMNVTAFDVTAEMITEGKKRHGNVPGLQLFEGDVRNFRFDISPVDFCYGLDFGHILSIGDIKKAFVCINNHLRDGGGLVIETTLPPTKSYSYPLQTFMPSKQVYPGLKVWKTGEGRFDAELGRHYISQKFYAEDDNGHIESFEHSFYLQSYSREEWLSAFAECGFEIVGEYSSRDVDSWQSGGDGFRIFEAIKSITAKQRYNPAISFDHLQTPIFRYENVGLYNDSINLQQPNDGYLVSYRFDINADENWVGWINIKVGYSISAYYDGQIGFMINDEQYRNRGYITNACLALLPFLRQCGFKYVLITTDENNTASRRVCEKIGAILTKIVDTPTWTGIYRQGQRRTCIYEWRIDEMESENNE